DAGCDATVFPIAADAHNLPFAHGFFDAIIAATSYLYYGTDERYLAHIVPFLKPSGIIGVVDVCFAHEVASANEAPQYLRETYSDYWYYVHTVEWWRAHWEKTGLVDILCAEVAPQ